MPPSLIQVLILAIVQGVAEMLPVSSSAHVIVAEKLLHLDPSSPQMTFILVMLHTGTMFAAIAYFWKAWVRAFGPSNPQAKAAWAAIIVATFATGVLGEFLNLFFKKALSHGTHVGEVEELFSNLYLIAGALAAAGLLILLSAKLSKPGAGKTPYDVRRSVLIGLMQGLCLPFRGLSRSGTTISTAMILGVERRQSEEFSFILAVVLTPVVVGLELLRLMKLHPSGVELGHAVLPGLLGMVFSFFAALVGLRWLSKWLESGRWGLFGIYCLAAAVAIGALAASGV